MSIRIAKIVPPVITTGNGSGIELPMPHIEGLLILPQLVVMTIDTPSAGDNVLAGLSFQRDHAGPGSMTDAWSDPTIWLYHNFGGEPTARIDLRGLQVELAGPQAFVIRNDGGGTRALACTMWYDTRNTDLSNWAAIAQATSFED